MKLPHVLLASTALLLAACVDVKHTYTAPASASAPPATQPSVYKERLVFVTTNLDLQENIDTILKDIERAGKAGYTHIVITDCKFFRWNRYPGYTAKAQKVRQAIKDNGMKFIAICCDQGSDLISQDSSLAEGTPVVDAPFVIKNGQLTPADNDFKILDPSFNNDNRLTPSYWTFVGNTKIDSSTAHDGKSSLLISDPTSINNGAASAKQIINVKPFRYYYLSAWVKTDNFEKARSFDINLTGNTCGQGLSHRHYGTKPTQDWTKVQTTFNTFDNTQVELNLSTNGGGKGKLWVDDLHVEPAGLVNLVRREKLPVKVTSPDGKIVYTEGKDLEKVVDPKSNMGAWRGHHIMWPEQKPVVKILPGGRLKEGDEVRISYNVSQMSYEWGVFACPSEPKTLELVKWQIQQIHKNLKPDGYMMAHDEIRHWGWDASCQATGKTCGQILAENVKACYQIIHTEDPDKPVYVWSDMFDPTHNAKKTTAGKPYYLCRGLDPFAGSWEGLDPRVNVIVWWAGNPKRQQSAKFFADRGHKLILSTSNPTLEGEWMEETTRVGNAIGTMFTVWDKNYDKLEAWGKMLDEWKPGKFQLKPAKETSDLD